VDVWLIDAQSGEVVYRAGTSAGLGSRTEVKPRLKPGEEGIVGWVAGNGKPLLVNDVHQDARYREWATLPDTRSELAVPVNAGDTAIGVLNVESEVRNAFHSEDVSMMQALADQVAVAIHNAQRFGDQARRVAELETLLRERDAKRG
jgi:GAF domain-containing protein